MILPGGTLGILGGGQLGRMLAVEARRMGYKVGVLDPAADCPAAGCADFFIQAALDSEEGALRLAEKCDVVTLEWELFPAAVLARLEKVKPVYPSSSVLGIIQDRLTQKQFLRENGFPQARFAPVGGAEELAAASRTLGFPCILKRRRAGYDGKGQKRLNSEADLAACAELLEKPCVLEAVVNFQCEVSVVLARRADGKTKAFPIPENEHRNGILHISKVPSRLSVDETQTAERMAASIAERLGAVGVIGVEMFRGADGLHADGFLVNEIAPRVHNSGHYTLGACATSQFEQHWRAVCGLELGDASLLTPAVMLNLLGDLWKDGKAPRWETVLARPNARLHLYGKTKASPGRKMGHAVFLGSNLAALSDQAASAFKDLSAG